MGRPFIDGRNLGHLINRRTRELSPEDIQKIADTYHAWLVGADCIRPNVSALMQTNANDPALLDGTDCIRPNSGSNIMGKKRAHAMRPYEDVAGFCASVPIARVAELDYVLTLGRYVGLPEEEALNRAIADNLARI